MIILPKLVTYNPVQAPAAMLNQQQPVLEDFDPYRITDTTDIPEPDPVLMINGEVIAAIEDIFTISGASKSGKSAFQNVLIAGAISRSGQVIDGFDGVEVLWNEYSKAVIHIDTEQARHKHQRNIRTIIHRAGLSTCPDYFLSYNIRQLDLNQYGPITTGICEAAALQCAGIHSVWIDGGADFIADVNDPETSNAAIKFFEELAIKYHTAVFIIVHTNPGSDKERGHFGSQCQRKSGGIISVKTEGDFSFIETKMLRYARNSDIPQLTFRYDKDKGYHVGCAPNSSEEKEAIKMRSKIISVLEVCTKVFGGYQTYEYHAAVEQIMKHRACSERTAKSDFTQMKIHGMILQGSDKNWRTNQNYINEL